VGTNTLEEETAGNVILSEAKDLLLFVFNDKQQVLRLA
jgi:hypothetical protein